MGARDPDHERGEAQEQVDDGLVRAPGKQNKKKHGAEGPGRVAREDGPVDMAAQQPSPPAIRDHLYGPVHDHGTRHGQDRGEHAHENEPARHTEDTGDESCHQRGKKNDESADPAHVCGLRPIVGFSPAFCLAGPSLQRRGRLGPLHGRR